MSNQPGNAHQDEARIRRGRITAVYPPSFDTSVNPPRPVVYVDILPYDMRQPLSNVPVILKHGLYRMPRKGQSVVFEFVDGQSRSPVVLGHQFNAETTADFADPVPLDAAGAPVTARADDLALYHAETGAFLRVRNNADPDDQTVLPDGGPALFEIRTISGAVIAITESTQSGYPDSTFGPPIAAALAISMPGVGMAPGASITIDALGNVTIHSPGTILLDAGATSETVSLDGVAHKIESETTSGLTHSLDDATQRIEAATPGGLKHRLDDVTGEAATLAPKVALGDVTANLSSTQAAITKTDVTALGGSIDSQRLSDLIALITAAQAQPGAPSWITTLLAEISGWAISNLGGATPIPNGSSVVRVKQ